jgi:formylglycine-generating enzyme required for sulfatase activity
MIDNPSVAHTPIQSVAPTSIEKFCEGAAAKSIGIEMLSVESSSAFRLAKTEITQRQFAAILKRNPTTFAAIDQNLERPADSISWYDAAEFCNALSQIEGLPPRYLLHGIVRDSQGCITSARAEITTSHGYRLPSESEWLQASCSKTNVLLIDPATIERSAWLTPWANNISHPVATKSPNEFGFHDLFGNVWEWCEDAWIDEQTSGPIARVVRGGAWCDGIAATACDFRSGISAGTRNSPFGFRIAVDAHPLNSTR